ncbi:ARC6, IMS domain, partial [Dillenia turbinata]
MAFVNPLPSVGFSQTNLGIDQQQRKLYNLKVVDPTNSLRNFRFRRRHVLVRSLTLSASAATSSQVLHNANASRAGVEIPVTCYQIIGAPNQAEKDEIVKLVLNLKNAEVEEGYTMDVVSSRQDLLMDVRDKLLFEPEYAGNVREKILPKPSLRIHWAWLPGALCLLQEVGEEKLVLDIGKAALPHPDAKPYVHDLLLSMALAECAIAKTYLEKNKVSHGFEALARAQCLLRSKASLGKLVLLSQIEESLEELAPACTLEILGLPCTPENAERRRGAISALRELVRQGLDVETPCQVQDWPCFLTQAFNKLMAAEIVGLLQWDSLVDTRRNKKSFESQNQRVVIDFNCFYTALIAHMALGFSSKQKELIVKAKTIAECLMVSEGIDLNFEESFCSFLLGQGDEAAAVERLQQLESTSSPASQNSIPRKEINNSSSANKSLEMWLKDAVLGVFPDTRDCSPSLVNFFGGGKKAPGNVRSKAPQPAMPSVSHRPLSDLGSDNVISQEKTIPHVNTSWHLGSAVKQLAPANLQDPLVVAKAAGGDVIKPSTQLKRNLTVNHEKVLHIWWPKSGIIGRITALTVLGCITFAGFKLSTLQFERMPGKFIGLDNKSSMKPSSTSWAIDSSLDHRTRPARMYGSRFSHQLKKLLGVLKMQRKNYPDAGKLPTSCHAASMSMHAVSKRPMPLEEAEALVQQWQTIKAEALGPNHLASSLPEILDETMLVQWETLADAAKARSCFWRFLLLQLSVLRADMVSDGVGLDLAEIEALLEEAAELVDESQPKNPNYYSTYKVRYVLRRQEDGSWKFVEATLDF